MAVWFFYMLMVVQGLSGLFVEANNRRVGGNSRQEGVNSVQDGMKEGCVMAVTITPRHSLASLQYNLTIKDTTRCQEKEEWNLQLKFCGDDENRTERIGKEENTSGIMKVRKSGQYRLMILDGENRTSTCEELKGYEFDGNELNNVIYMEFNEQRATVKVVEDPRVQNVEFTIYEGSSKECGHYSKKFAEKNMVQGEMLEIRGPFKRSLQYCFQWILHGYENTTLIYPITIKYDVKKPSAVREKQPSFKWWQVGVGVGVVLVVVGEIVVVLVVLSKKIWLPSSPADHTVKTIWGRKTVEVLLLYTSDVERSPHLRFLKKQLSALWMVLDLNEVLPKRRVHERLTDRHGWLLKVLQQEEGVKVVVVESAKLLNLQASILEGKPDLTESPLEMFQRNALRNILAMGATNYHKIFVVRFSDEVRGWRESRRWMENSLIMGVCDIQTTKTSPDNLLDLTTEPLTQAEKQTQTQKQAQTPPASQTTQPQTHIQIQTPSDSQTNKTQTQTPTLDQIQAQTPPVGLTTKTQTQTPPGNQTTQAQTHTHTQNTEKGRVEILVKNCRYVLPGHISQLMGNLKGEKGGGGHQV